MNKANLGYALAIAAAVVGALLSIPMSTEAQAILAGVAAVVNALIPVIKAGPGGAK